MGCGEGGRGGVTPRLVRVRSGWHAGQRRSERSILSGAPCPRIGACHPLERLFGHGLRGPLHVCPAHYCPSYGPGPVLLLCIGALEAATPPSVLKAVWHLESFTVPTTARVQGPRRELTSIWLGGGGGGFLGVCFFFFFSRKAPMAMSPKSLLF